MTTALGVSVDENDNGVTPLTHRMIIGSFFQNKGGVEGLKVTGRSDLEYAVAAGGASSGFMRTTSPITRPTRTIRCMWVSRRAWRPRTR